ncbi:MAG: hypothetical protein AAGK97_04620, partial [Bacteroidota bacterium]
QLGTEDAVRIFTGKYTGYSTSKFHIYDSGNTGLRILDDCTFTNQGELIITKCNNEQGIIIDNGAELVNSSNGIVKIGLTGSPNITVGIQNYGEITNYGEIKVGNTTSHGVNCRPESIFNNMGYSKLYIGGGGGENTCNDTEVTLTIILDDFPEETTWNLKNSAGTTLYSGGPYSSPGGTVTETFCLVDDCYEFQIRDSEGDGICCQYGQGSYEITVDGLPVASSRGQFNYSQIKNFCIDPLSFSSGEMGFIAEETTFSNLGTIAIGQTGSEGFTLSNCPNAYNGTPGNIEVGDLESDEQNISDIGIRLLNNTTLTSYGDIEIAGTNGTGMKIDESSLTNYGNVTVYNVGNYGLNVKNSDFFNEGDGVVTIDSTKDAAVTKHSSSSFENRGLIEIGKNQEVAYDATYPFSLKLSGLLDLFLNDECGEIFLYKKVDAGSSVLTNQGYIFFDALDAHQGSGTINNTGIVHYAQESYFPNVTNQAIVIKPMLLSCTGENAILIDNANTWTIATSWYKDEALTIEAGTYSQDENEFTPTNISPNGPMDVYFEVTSANDCTMKIKSVLHYDSFNPSTPKWVGRVSTEWDDPCNWDVLKVPTANKDVEIVSGDYDPVISDDVILKSLTIKNGGKLDISDSGSLAIENPVINTLTIDQGGTLNNYGFISIIDSALIGPLIYGTFNNYDSISIQNKFFGILIEDGGAFNLLDGGVNMTFNELAIWNKTGGAFNTSVGSNFYAVVGGVSGVNDRILENYGTFQNNGNFNGVYFFVAPEVGTIPLMNYGTITNAGTFKTFSFYFDDTVLLNQGVLQNNGLFELESTFQESEFSISNTGSISNSIGGSFLLKGFEKLNCSSGSTLVNGGNFLLTRFE